MGAVKNRLIRYTSRTPSGEYLYNRYQSESYTAFNPNGGSSKYTHHGYLQGRWDADHRHQYYDAYNQDPIRYSKQTTNRRG